MKKSSNFFSSTSSDSTQTQLAATVTIEKDSKVATISSTWDHSQSLACIILLWFHLCRSCLFYSLKLVQAVTRQNYAILKSAREEVGGGREGERSSNLVALLSCPYGFFLAPLLLLVSYQVAAFFKYGC